jgi:hypothetical protein
LAAMIPSTHMRSSRRYVASSSRSLESQTCTA